MQRRLISASVISVGFFATGQGIRFVGNIVLAKFLSPESFGIVAIVNLLIIGINLFSDIGLRQLGIQHQGDLSRSYLNTLWTMQLIRGVVIWLLTIIIGLALLYAQAANLLEDASSYADPLLPFLIAGAGSSAIFQGLESTKVITERRALALARLSAIGLLSQIASMIIMISLAYFSPSAWALVCGGIAAAIVNSSLTHLSLPGEPDRLHFDPRIASQLLRSGKWIFLSSAVTFLGGSADILILGGLVDSRELGNYVIAFQLVNVLQVLVGTLSANVVFPALSAHRREGLVSLKAGYRRIQLWSDFLVLTASGVLLTASQSIISLLFDTRYELAGVLLGYLAIGGIGLRFFVVEQLMNAEANFRTSTIIAIFRLSVLAGGTYFGFRIGGIQGAALGASMSAFTGWPIGIYYRQKTVGTFWLGEAAAVAFLGIGMSIGAAFSYAMQDWK